MSQTIEIEASDTSKIEPGYSEIIPYNFYTYQEGRLCRFCGAPIADQMHKTREFCPREVLPDGSIKNCKDDYHSSKGKLDQVPFQNFLHYHKSCSESLNYLYNLNLPQINLEILDELGIDLSRCAKHEVAGDEQRFIYIGFCITVTPDSSFVKLIVHNETIF